MADHVYKSIEVIGSSTTSIDDAIRGAIAKAASTVRQLEWFQVDEVRGAISDGAPAYFQVTVKLGFRLD